MARVTRARERQAAKEVEINDRIRKATESGTAGYGPAVERVDRYSRALQQLQAKSDPVFRAELQAQREMAQAYRVVNDAAARGIGTKEQHLRILDAERRRLEEVTRAAQQQGRLPANDNRAIQATTQSYTALRTQAVAATAGLIAFGYAAQRIAGAIATAGDEIRVMAARMNVLTGAAQDSRVAFDQVFAVAQRTGTGLEDVAGSFSRLAISATEFGATTPQIAQVTETLAKLGRIGGATTQEIAAGMQQLGQALSSGVLQGDELRSLRENLPLVVRAIAKEFQVSVGQIKQLGEEGKLTSDRVFRALISASAEADAAFRKLPQTVDQASARSSNAWKLFSAALDDSLGISKLLASSMAATAERVEELARRMAGDIVLAIRDVRAEAARLEAEAAKGKPPEQAAPRSPSFFGPGRVISFEEQQAARNAARAADLRRNADEMERWYRGLTDEAGVVEHTDAAARARQKQTADTTKFLRDLQERADPAAKALRTFNEEKAKLDAAWKSGIIDQATYNRGLADARKIMSSVGQAAKDTAESIKALADVANEAAFAKRLAASAYEGAAALAKIEADAKAAEKALEVFGRRNAPFEQQYSASVLATRNA
ncbi:tape measure protein, partial [Vineibacter terrae]|uniref:tape measure protein n=1 Tax=Vineibacter terrae TaxID=2586908 RepID=UPI002E310149